MVGIFVPLALGSDSLPVRIDAADAGAAVATESGVKIDDAGPAVAAVAADDVRGTGPNGQDFDDALTFQNPKLCCKQSCHTCCLVTTASLPTSTESPFLLACLFCILYPSFGHCLTIEEVAANH